jgi:hypothetical protein
MRRLALPRSSPARAFGAAALALSVVAGALLPASPACAAWPPAAPVPAPVFVDIGEAPGAGHLQLAPAWLPAGGLGRLVDGDAQARPTAVRVGLGAGVELRATTIADGERDAPAARPGAFGPLAGDPARIRRWHGVADVALGVRWRVRGGDAGWLPGVAWLAEAETPTGGPAFRAADAHPSLRATAAWALPHDWTLALTPGVFRDRDEAGRHHACGLLAATMGHAWTPRLRGFVELAARGGAGGRGARTDADMGLAFAATQALQVAAVLSRGLAVGTPDPRAGLSVSARF